MFTVMQATLFILTQYIQTYKLITPASLQSRRHNVSETYKFLFPKILKYVCFVEMLLLLYKKTRSKRVALYTYT